MTPQSNLFPARVYTDEEDSNTNLLSPTPTPTSNSNSNSNSNDEEMILLSRNNHDDRKNNGPEDDEGNEGACFPTARLCETFSPKRQLLLFILGAIIGTVLEYVPIKCGTFLIMESNTPETAQPFYRLFLKFGTMADVFFMYSFILAYICLLAYQVSKKTATEAVSASICHVVASVYAGIAVGFCVGTWLFLHPVSVLFMVHFALEEIVTIYAAYMAAVKIQTRRQYQEMLRINQENSLSEPLLQVM